LQPLPPRRPDAEGHAAARQQFGAYGVTAVDMAGGSLHSDFALFRGTQGSAPANSRCRLQSQPFPRKDVSWYTDCKPEIGMFATDPVKSASEAGLRYVRGGGPCIQ